MPRPTPSRLSGIWKNNSTNAECRLVKNGDYNNEIIGEGFEDTNLTETIQEKKMLQAAIDDDK